ncbi:MAG: hypothetical protein HYV02_07770 [Deltaproteobacteria bacterium]|nr:hypothetical protein [Deltaproteobacteria bacterium]
MKRLVQILCVFAVLVGLTSPLFAAPKGRLIPIGKYLATDSVMGRYYAHYINRYGHGYANAAETFRSFCRVLRTSDLLADELLHAGVPTDLIYQMLTQLEQLDFRTSEPQAVRRLLLAVDYALESIESAIAQSHRSEFLREVLAQVPPLTHNG